MTTWRSIGRREECPSATTPAIGKLPWRPNEILSLRRGSQVRYARSSLSRKLHWNKSYEAYINYMIFTGIFDMPNYRQPMRYFFHIFDGPKVYPDEGGSSPLGSRDGCASGREPSTSPTLALVSHVSVPALGHWRPLTPKERTNIQRRLSICDADTLNTIRRLRSISGLHEGSIVLHFSVCSRPAEASA